MPCRISPQEFDGLVLAALEKLPPEFFERLQIENVDIVVEPEPALAKRLELGLRPGESLFGLSEGVSLRDGGSHMASMPSKITIYQRPLEDSVATYAQLADEVTKTVWHEVGHFLGFDEDEVADLGLA